MTQAICVNCGSIKFGAFTECGACGIVPQTEIDRAYSLALTDHFLSIDELHRISDAMRAGKRPVLPKEQENQFLDMLRSGSGSRDP
jgi:hypothetical protein